MSGINIYVGNLSFDANEDQLRELFETYGRVDSAKIISDQFTGRSRGFGFVEMSEREEGDASNRRIGLQRVYRP
jgi:RNA recognition motif-containing protein